MTGDPLGGRFIWTQSTELHYPLPVSPDLGLSGRAFVDVGGLTQASFITPCTEPASLGGGPCQVVSSPAPSVGVGVGISWHTRFGLHQCRPDAVRGKAAARSNPDFPIRLRYEVLVLQSRLLVVSVIVASAVLTQPWPSAAQQSPQWFVPNQPRPAAPRSAAARPAPAPQAEQQVPGTSLLPEGTAPGAGGPGPAAGAGATAAAAGGAPAAERSNAARGHRRRPVGAGRDARLQRLPAGRQGVRRAAAKAERGRTEGAGDAARSWPGAGQ